MIEQNNFTFNKNKGNTGENYNSRVTTTFADGDDLHFET